MAMTYTQEGLFGWGPSMKKPLILSALFHLTLLILTAVGIPMVVKTNDIISPPINVEIVDVSELTQTTRIAPPQKAEEPKDIPLPPPEKKEEPPQMLEEAPPEPAVPLPPEETEEVIKEEPPAKPVAPPKRKPKPPEKAKPKETKDFASLLKNLTPDIQEEASEVQESVSEEPAPSDISQIADLSDKLSISEEDALRRQLAQCWNVLAGAKYAEDLVVEVRVQINPDRTVARASILNNGRYNQDAHYRAAADAALRALRNPRCTPLALPPEKYEQWKTTVITFDPSDML